MRSRCLSLLRTCEQRERERAEECEREVGWGGKSHCCFACTRSLRFYVQRFICPASGPHGFSFFFLHSFRFVCFLPVATGRRRHRHRFLRFPPARRSFIILRSLLLLLSLSLSLTLLLSCSSLCLKWTLLKPERTNFLCSLRSACVFVCTFITMLAYWLAAPPLLFPTVHFRSFFGWVLLPAGTISGCVLTLRLRLQYDVILFYTSLNYFIKCGHLTVSWFLLTLSVNIQKYIWDWIHVARCKLCCCILLRVTINAALWQLCLNWLPTFELHSSNTV